MQLYALHVTGKPQAHVFRQFRARGQTRQYSITSMRLVICELAIRKRRGGGEGASKVGNLLNTLGESGVKFHHPHTVVPIMLR